MHIVSMTELSPAQHEEAARILSESLPLGWPTAADAREEIRDLLGRDCTLLAALERDTVLGWGGILEPDYDGRVFELHPLAVRGDMRRRGIGRAIVSALEEAARSRGGLTLRLGCDDETGETSLADADLYTDLPGCIASFDARGHASGFYLRLGYRIVGVVPDANGPGRPDIFLARPLQEKK